MNEPPNWIDEPHWAHFENEPMAFLHQFKIWAKNRKFIKKFPIGDMIYVFGSKSPVNPSSKESWHVVHKIVVTDENGYFVHNEES